jgi:putative endonuclease
VDAGDTGESRPPSRDGGRKARGRAGEEAAVALLERRGYVIVDANVRLGARRDGLPGELDIVAWDGPTLCFVEVKTRRAGGRAPIEGVTQVKQRQIARLALAYASRHGLLDDDSEVPMRFDVVSVLVARATEDHQTDDAAADVGLVRRVSLAQGAFLGPDGFADD